MPRTPPLSQPDSDPASAAAEAVETFAADALRHSEARLAGQAAALEMAVSGAPMHQVLERIVRAARELAGAGARAALFRVDRDNAHLRFAASADMSAEYTAEIDGFDITPDNPSCGSAAYTGRTVIVRDVALDPLWKPFLELAERHGIRACWSFPIRTFDRIAGTLAVYHSTPREPHPRDMDSIELLAQTAAVILEWHQEAEERRRAEAELRHAKEAAERASEAKSEFLAMLSHEIRTPLTGVIGYADLLSSQVLGAVTPRQLEALSRIKSSTWHVAGIIDEVLTLSRAEASREPVTSEPTDLAGIIREVIRIVQPQADEARLELRCEQASEPAVLRTDTGKVRQILVNLVGNAIKYTEDGSVTIVLDRSDDEAYHVHVRDTGPGIEAADHERIFEPFVQASRPHRGTSPGTGLGLAISQRLAQLIGGAITLQSAPDHGSTFSLRLPREPVTPA